jgi:hypothetical protein
MGMGTVAATVAIVAATVAIIVIGVTITAIGAIGAAAITAGAITAGAIPIGIGAGVLGSFCGSDITSGWYRADSGIAGLAQHTWSLS